MIQKTTDHTDLIYPRWCKSDLLILLSWQLSKDLVQAEAISLG